MNCISFEVLKEFVYFMIVCGILGILQGFLFWYIDKNQGDFRDWLIFSQMFKEDVTKSFHFGSDDICVYKSYYDNILIGQKVLCKYTNGRIKKSLYIKSIE